MLCGSILPFLLLRTDPNLPPKVHPLSAVVAVFQKVDGEYKEGGSRELFKREEALFLGHLDVKDAQKPKQGDKPCSSSTCFCLLNAKSL